MIWSMFANTFALLTEAESPCVCTVFITAPSRRLRRVGDLQINFQWLSYSFGLPGWKTPQGFPRIPSMVCGLDLVAGPWVHKRQSHDIEMDIKKTLCSRSRVEIPTPPFCHLACPDLLWGVPERRLLSVIPEQS